MPPRGLVGPVLAMGRPRRPSSEAALVRAALADGRGSIAQRARRLACEVAALAIREVDGDPGDRVSLLLAAAAASPAALLAIDPDIDTASMVRVERARRMEARAWRRLPEVEWPAEDRAVAAAIGAILAGRYARLARLCA